MSTIGIYLGTTPVIAFRFESGPSKSFKLTDSHYFCTDAGIIKSTVEKLFGQIKHGVSPSLQHFSRGERRADRPGVAGVGAGDHPPAELL